MGHVNTIFLADDDADDRMLLADAIKLTDPEIKVIEAENGEELIRILLSRPPAPDNSLVILDMYMPKMNGLETLATLRSAHDLETLPVVMVSAFQDPYMILFAKQLGTLSYFTKPSGMDDVQGLVSQLLFEIGRLV